MIRTPIDKLLDKVQWVEIRRVGDMPNDGLPYATHEGVLRIDHIELKCYQLNDGRRIFDEASIMLLLRGMFDTETGP